MLGQVALEEESGKATNGLGFAVVDRGPRELWRSRLRSSAIGTSLRSRAVSYREAWALTEPGAGPISLACRRPPFATATTGS